MPEPPAQWPASAAPEENTPARVVHPVVVHPPLPIIQANWVPPVDAAAEAQEQDIMSIDWDAFAFDMCRNVNNQVAAKRIPVPPTVEEEQSRVAYPANAEERVPTPPTEEEEQTGGTLSANLEALPMLPYIPEEAPISTPVPPTEVELEEEQSRASSEALLPMLPFIPSPVAPSGPVATMRDPTPPPVVEEEEQTRVTSRAPPILPSIPAVAPSIPPAPSTSVTPAVAPSIPPAPSTSVTPTRKSVEELVSLLEKTNARGEVFRQEEAEMEAQKKAFLAAFRRRQRDMESRRQEWLDDLAALEAEIHEVALQRRHEQEAAESGKINVTFLIFRFFLSNCCFLFCSPKSSGN